MSRLQKLIVMVASLILVGSSFWLSVGQTPDVDRDGSKEKEASTFDELFADFDPTSVIDVPEFGGSAGTRVAQDGEAVLRADIAYLESELDLCLADNANAYWQAQLEASFVTDDLDRCLRRALTYADSPEDAYIFSDEVRKCRRMIP